MKKLLGLLFLCFAFLFSAQAVDISIDEVEKGEEFIEVDIGSDVTILDNVLFVQKEGFINVLKLVQENEELISIRTKKSKGYVYKVCGTEVYFNSFCDNYINRKEIVINKSIPDYGVKIRDGTSLNKI